MPRPWRVTYSGAKYHIASRGNGRQCIFLVREDYERFLDQLSSGLEKDEVILYAYVLLANHYHLLVETPLENIKRFMQRLNTAYGMYFRYKHAKPGHCFQGRYGAKLVGGDEYIVRLTRYIHLNPIRTRKMGRVPVREQIRCLNKYLWSSYLGYVDKAHAKEVVDYRWLGLMGRKTVKGNRAAYRRYLEGIVGEKDMELTKALTASRYAIGDEKFVEETESDLREIHLARACGGGDIYRPRERIGRIEAIEKEVAKILDVQVADLHVDGHRAGLAKALAVELSCQLTGKSQREVGRYFGYSSDSSVVKQRKKLQALLKEDKALAKREERLKRKLLKEHSTFKV